MRKDYELLKVYLLKLAAYTLPYHAIAALLLTITGFSGQPCLFAFLLILPALLFLLVRLKIRNYVWFTLLHLGILALSLLFGTKPTEKMVYFCAVFIMFCDSYRIAFSKKEEWEHRTSYFCVLVFAGCYMISDLMGYTSLLPVFVGELIAYLTVYILLQASFKTWYFLATNSALPNLPVKQIRHVSHTLIFLFGLVACLVMLLLAQIPAETPWGALSGGVRWLISGFLFLAAKLLTPLFHLQDANSVPGHTSSAPDGPWAQEAALPAWAELLENVFLAVLFILAIAAILFGLGYVFYLLQKRFAARAHMDADVVEYVGTDETENGIGRTRRGVSTLFKPETNPQKARRLYRRYVNRQRKKNDTIPPAYTPAEISVKVGTMGTQEDAQIRAIYEKARYSQQMISKEELQKIKKNK